MDKKSRLEGELRLTETGRNFLEAVDEPDAIIIPEGATNGDMIKAMFNCMVLCVSKGKVYVEHIYFPFDEDWWNAPYNKQHGGRLKNEDRL